MTDNRGSEWVTLLCDVTARDGRVHLRSHANHRVDAPTADALVLLGVAKRIPQP